MSTPMAAQAGATLRTIRALPTLLRVGLAGMVAYRAELIIWILTATTPLIMLLVWDKAAAGGPIGGYNQPDFARYFTAGLVVRQLTSSWIVWVLNYSIRTGELSPTLLKPVHPMVVQAAENVVALPFRIAVLLPVVGLLWWWHPEMGIPLRLAEVPLLVLSIGLAWAMSFLVQVAIGSTAFFIGQSLGLFNAWFALWAIFSGYLFPLDLLPKPVAAIAWVLPFRSMLAVPTEIAAGQLHGDEARWAVALQGAWLLAVAAVAVAVWRAGVRRYEAYGA